MFRPLSIAALAWVASLVISPALSAAELAPEGSVWTGAGQRFGPPDQQGRRIITSDVELKITERDGESFQGEFAIVRGTRKLVLEGKIKKNGGIQATPTKLLTGEWPSDLIGRAKVVGTVKDNQMKLRFSIPQGVRFGEIVLKRKADAKDEDD